MSLGGSGEGPGGYGRVLECPGGSGRVWEGPGLKKVGQPDTRGYMFLIHVKMV